MPGIRQPVSLEKPVPQDSILTPTPMIHCEVGDESNGSISASSQTNASITMASEYPAEDCNSFHSKRSNASCLMDGSVINGLSSSSSTLLHANRSAVGDAHLSSSSMNSEVSNTSMPNGHLDHSENADSHNSVEFPQYFHEGYCKVSEIDDSRELTEAVTDADSSSSHCGREKQEDGDNDDMLGGVFAFSEEGILLTIAVELCAELLFSCLMLPLYFYCLPSDIGGAG